jgi:hypothetical protein
LILFNNHSYYSINMWIDFNWCRQNCKTISSFHRMI